MKRYQPNTPRIAIVFAAIAMTALTLELSVVGPANMGSERQLSTTVVASQTSGKSLNSAVVLTRAAI